MSKTSSKSGLRTTRSIAMFTLCILLAFSLGPGVSALEYINDDGTVTTWDDNPTDWSHGGNIGEQAETVYIFTLADYVGWAFIIGIIIALGIYLWRTDHSEK